MILHIQVEKHEGLGYMAYVDKALGIYASGESIQDAVMKVRSVTLAWLSTEILTNEKFKPDDSASIVFSVHVPPAIIPNVAAPPPQALGKIQPRGGIQPLGNIQPVPPEKIVAPPSKPAISKE